KWAARAVASPLFGCSRGGLDWLDVHGVHRAGFRRPGRAKIGELDLPALDLKAQRRAARERQRPPNARQVGRLERDGKQVEDLVLFGRRTVAALAGRHALEAQRREPAPKPRKRANARLPVAAGEA